MTRTYVLKTPRPTCNVKSFLIHRVFGPGRTRQVDAATTLVEASASMRTLAAAVVADEVAAFVVTRKGKLVDSLNLEALNLVESLKAA